MNDERTWTELTDAERHNARLLAARMLSIAVIKPDEGPYVWDALKSIGREWLNSHGSWEHTDQ